MTSTEHDDVLPASSVAVIVTVVVELMIVPEAGVCERVTAASQMSDVVTRPVRSGITALQDASMGST
jgi:hypothetical protein